MKYIFNITRADKDLSESLDRIFVAKPPPTENERSDSTEVGFAVIKALKRFSRYSLRFLVAANNLKSSFKVFGKSLSAGSSTAADIVF